MTTAIQSPKTYPVLLEFLPAERRFQDEGPDKLPADIGGGKLTLAPDSCRFNIDWDVFAWTHADESQPQLMTGGRVVSMCQDFGGAHLAVHKPKKPPEFPFSGLDISSYCVAPNGTDLYCTDQEGRLFLRSGNEAPQRIGRRKGFRVHGFDSRRKNLVLTSRKDDELIISALDPERGSTQVLKSIQVSSDERTSALILSPSGKSLFRQDGLTITRIGLDDDSTQKTEIHTEGCFCKDEFRSGPYIDEVLEQEHLCGPTLTSVLDDSHFVLAEDSFGYEEDDYNAEWPFWERAVWIQEIETGDEYYRGWMGADEMLNIVPMNGESGGWSRYHRRFEEEPSFNCR